MLKKVLQMNHKDAQNAEKQENKAEITLETTSKK